MAHTHPQKIQAFEEFLQRRDMESTDRERTHKTHHQTDTEKRYLVERQVQSTETRGQAKQWRLPKKKVVDWRWVERLWYEYDKKNFVGDAACKEVWESTGSNCKKKTWMVNYCRKVRFCPVLTLFENMGRECMNSAWLELFCWSATNGSHERSRQRSG